MIDLHLHTTASDGRSAPAALVREAVSAGITTMAVTDHDTTAAWSGARSAAGAAGVDCVPGIEITAIHSGRDVHVLGYFFDPDHAELARFLEAQRANRRRRMLEIGARLERLGVPVDLDRAMGDAGHVAGRSVGRPIAAAALVAAGHVATLSEAFDRYLAEGRPAFIERIGIPPAEVVALIARAGGISSLAHPGKLQLDHVIRPLSDAGLTAIEVFHPDHDEIDTARYRVMAGELGLLVTGGSDYHGAGSGREGGLGRIHLPADEYARLVERRAGPAAPR